MAGTRWAEDRAGPGGRGDDEDLPVGVCGLAPATPGHAGRAVVDVQRGHGVAVTVAAATAPGRRAVASPSR